MTQKLIRIAYVCEFLLAMMAIFTAWPEIGGEGALEIMHWGWKLGFGCGLAAAVVGYTATIVSGEKLWTVRAVSWLVLITLITIGMGVVTYYYTLEEEAGDTDEPTGTVNVSYPGVPTTAGYS